MAKIKNCLGRNLSTESSKDKLSKSGRSNLMSKIRSKETNLELKFFSSLKSARIKFESHPKDVYGHPDAIIRKSKICIFIDSSFWHGWQFPRWKHKMSDSWQKKIQQNRVRDKQVTRYLRYHGYEVIRLWEHQIKVDIQGCILKIKSQNSAPLKK